MLQFEDKKKKKKDYQVTFSGLSLGTNHLFNKEFNMLLIRTLVSAILSNSFPFSTPESECENIFVFNPIPQCINMQSLAIQNFKLYSKLYQAMNFSGNS